jgi:hypothetical protein
MIRVVGYLHSAWRVPGEEGPATGAIKEISATRALASFRAARGASIAPIVVSTRPPIGRIEVSSWIVPIDQPNGEQLEERRQ